MSLVFYLRGTGLDARYSAGGKEAGKVGNPKLVSSVDSSVFGGSLISTSDGAGVNLLHYNGRENWTSNPAFSILLRIAPNYTGAPVGSDRTFYVISGTGGLTNGVQFIHQTSGALRIIIKDGNNVYKDFFVPGVSFTSGVAEDLFLSVSGGMEAESIKFSREGVELATSVGAFEITSRDRFATEYISFGAAGSVFTRQELEINEFAIWDNTAPTEIGGSHEYSARTDFLSVDFFDGRLSQDPLEANVLSGVSYTINGLSKTGTAGVQFIGTASGSAGTSSASGEAN